MSPSTTPSISCFTSSEGHSYRNYWFETGNPSFLIKLFQRQCYFLPDLEQLEAALRRAMGRQERLTC